jgi:hypothetical protein
MIIYQRSTNRVAFPRAVLALSTFNSTYWLWYTLDFIPTVNASSLDQIHIDYTFGFLGMAISLTLQAATLVYPQRLVSKIQYDPSTQDLTIFNHDVPTIWASSFSRTYPLGTVSLDAGSADAKQLVNEQELFRGALALKVHKNQWMPLLVDLQDDDDLPDPALFTKILVTPDQLVSTPHTAMTRGRSSSSNVAPMKKKNKANKKKTGTRVPAAAKRR